MKEKKFLGLVAVIAAIIATNGCASGNKESDRDRAIANLQPIRTVPSQRPDWVDETPKNSRLQYFVGMSQRYATERDARNNAQEDARMQLVDYYGTVMVNKGREYSATVGLSNEVFSPQTVAQRLNERIAQNVAQALGEPVYFTAVYYDDATGREAFVVAARLEIEKALVARTIDTFGKETAEDLQKQAAAEQDRTRRQQLEKAAEFFGGNLSSTLDL
jgi:hypothetical protein